MNSQPEFHAVSDLAYDALPNCEEPRRTKMRLEFLAGALQTCERQITGLARRLDADEVTDDEQRRTVEKLLDEKKERRRKLMKLRTKVREEANQNDEAPDAPRARKLGDNELPKGDRA